MHYLWPENVRAWDVWTSVQTQWRHGMQGATGLDYAAVGCWLDEQSLDADERRHVWRCVCAAEAAVLELLNEDAPRTASREG